MPRRRQILAGLGEGLSDASSILLRMHAQDRTDKRAADNAKAIAERQGELAIDNTLLELIQELAKGGNLDPSQLMATAELVGRKMPADTLERVAPLRRRLEESIGKPIEDATTVEGVLSAEDILGRARARGSGPMLGDEFLVPGALMDDPFGDSAPEVRELGRRADLKRRALREKPTQVVSGTRDDGSGFTQMVSPYALSEGMQTSPTSERQGVLKGEEEKSLLGVVGDARAEQKGKEAEAVQDVEMSEEAVNARVIEAARKEAATMSAAMPYQLRLAQQRALIEANASVEKDQKQATATAARAAGELATFFNQVRDLTAQINTFEGPMARVAGAARRGRQVIGADNQLTELDNLINQNLRRLAIAMGVREANVSEKETLQALKGIGLGAMKTATERRTALRNLYDLITIAPVVAGQTSGLAGVGERMSLASQYMQQRRAAEQAAIKAGYEAYIDPVTKAVTKVIR